MQMPIFRLSYSGVARWICAFGQILSQKSFGPVAPWVFGIDSPGYPFGFSADYPSTFCLIIKSNNQGFLMKESIFLIKSNYSNHINHIFGKIDSSSNKIYLILGQINQISFVFDEIIKSSSSPNPFPTCNLLSCPHASRRLPSGTTSSPTPFHFPSAPFYTDNVWNQEPVKGLKLKWNGQ